MTLTLDTADAAPTADQLAYIPLSRLILSPLNARQTVDEAEIAAMAESISFIGLLQNLIGLAQQDDGPVEIVAGGKRLRALQLLQAQGFMPRTDTNLDFNAIPVRLTFDTSDALEMAGAENAARTQPHPADEVRAYRAMRERGSPLRHIALALGQTEAHVKRRLALAGLPDPVLDALRADQITLDQAAAFTLAQSESDALAELAALQAPGAQAWHFYPRDIRNRLTENRPGAGDKMLKYIGLAAYTASGGTLTLDLFQDHSYVNDAALLTNLAGDKLRAEGTNLQTTEGWAWLELLDREADLWGKVDALPRTPGELTDADEDEYDRLFELANADALDEDGQIKLQALQDRADGDWTDEDRARAGIAVWINHDGTLGARRALIRRDAPKDESQTSGEDDTATTNTPAPEAGMPQNLRDDLRAIRLLSLQNALLDEPALLMDLLLWQISGGDMIAWQMPLNIKVDGSPNMPGNLDGLIVPARLARPEPGSTRMEPTPEAFQTARGNHHTAMPQVFATLARAFHLPTGLMSVHLAQTLKPNARTLWTPNARNFFGRVPQSMLDAIWADLVPADRESEHQTFAALQKKQKAAQLDKLFNSDDYREALGLSREEQTRIAGWLPEDLRWPEAEGEEGAA